MAVDILSAQQRALAGDQRIDTLSLDPVHAGMPSLPIASSVVGATSILTIEGASTVTLHVADEDWVIERSGLIQNDDNGRLAAVRITLDGLGYRLVKASRQDPAVLELTFEDEVVAMLRQHTTPLTASRGSMTRAQFIEKMVREVKARDIVFYSPEKGRRQAVARPDYPDARPQQGETGFDDGTRLKLTQWDGASHTLDADQMRNAATALETASQENAGEKATLALMEASIVEAPMFSNPTGGDDTSVGMLQLLDFHLNGSTSTRGGRRDVALVCRLFLTKGFSGKGGAIQLARENPSWSAGKVAQAVQGSAYPDRYDKVRSSARKVIAAWGGADGADTDEVTRVKAFQFKRGKANGEREDSWEAATRLAEDVRWRLFAFAGEVWFVSDDYLISKPAAFVLNGPLDDGLLEPPTYDRDNGKPVQESVLRVSANRWSVRPGEVGALQNFGPPLDGRWIIARVEQDLDDATQTEVTLVKALRPLKEPAPDVAVGQAPNSNVQAGDKGLVYPLARNGKNIGGPEAHAQRAWGNWQSDNAIDFEVPQGTGVYAVAGGEIVKLGGAWRGGSGNPDGFNVTLRTDDNEWFYTHLRHVSPRLGVGMRVTKGTFLGGSGAANGVPHLHIASKKGNPVELLQGARLPT